MGKLKDWWGTLEPRQQKFVIIGIAGLVVLLLAIVGGQGRQPQDPRQRTEKPQTTFLGDDKGEADIAALNAKLKVMEAARQQEARDREEMMKRLTRLQSAVSSFTQLQENPEQLASLVDELARVRADLDLVQANGGGIPTAAATLPAARAGDPFAERSVPGGTSASELLDPLEKVKGLRGKGGGEAGPAEEEVALIQIDGKSVDPKSPTTSSNRGAGGDPRQSARDRRGAEFEEVPDTVYLPSGSLFQGVLINGMDAPTGGSDRSDPFPVTIRLTSLAFLPNRFTTNLRECFVLAAGFGRLDDERVHLRTERLSCVTDASLVVDIPLEGYITGEDGKVGLRGTVVERTGALLAKTALAGLASGLSFALQPRIENSIQTGSEAGGIEYSQPDLGDMLESSAYAGVSQAMDRLAQYYLDRAEQIFPVIELDAMRTVNVHLTKGAALKLVDGATWGQLADTRK